MKKYIAYTFTILFFVMSIPMTSHAELMPYMPPTLPDISVVPDFLMTIGQMQIINDFGVTVQNRTDLNRVNQLVNGRSILDSIQMQYVDNSDLPQLQEFYDSSGNLIPQENTYCAFGTSDIGSFCFVASKETGQIVASYNELQEMQSTLCGGPRLNEFYQEFNNGQVPSIMETVANLDDTMIIFGNEVTEEEIETLERYDYYCYIHSDYYDFSMFCPNACSDQCLVTISSQSASGYIGQLKYEIHQQDGNVYAHYRTAVYAMDPSQVYFTGNTSFGLAYHPYSQWNQRWNYVNNWPSSQAIYLYGCIIDCKLPTSYQEYSANKLDTSDVVYLTPADNTGEVTNNYNYTEVMNHYSTPTTNYNDNYDYSQTTNIYNYPIENTVSYPDYSSTVNNYFETVNNYITRPQIDTENGGEIDSSNLTNNIPILSNLRRRFPFSIPWDIQAIFKGLVVEREAPNFHWSVYIAPIDYTWSVDIDLSQFNSTAALFRTLFLIAFIIGLAVFAYNHYFGS